jgi:aldehyde dehydrogenase (NAD+)
MTPSSILSSLGLGPINPGACGHSWIPRAAGDTAVSLSPRDGTEIAQVRLATREDYERVVGDAMETFLRWRLLPAPKRGEIVREIGLALREHKDALGALVSLEMGKILAEGKGEVQEMIDMADFATGLSRQLYGLTMHSERPSHRMYEQWHPLGLVGVITAFNFPVAVWAWNALLAAVCGDCVVWKPSHQTPLSAIAVQHICNRVLERHGWQGVFTLLIGNRAEVGDPMVRDPRIPLISATGSCKMGRAVGEAVSQRFGRALLELGGNNAIIVMEDASLDLAVRAILFGAVGTSGQRCTTTRRVFAQRNIIDTLAERLIAAYQQVRIGDPLDPHTLMGPLVNQRAVAEMQDALATILKQGGTIVCGGHPLDRPGGCFVEPAIVRVEQPIPLMQDEVFAPILYLAPFDTLDDAIAMQNDVPQGLSSAIFTTSLLHSERFLSVAGSDCGIANVNIGTSGAEIGGAFGGEKETGGGRESGSDSWKAYMRRQTVTVNYSNDLPLAQGIQFG